MRVKAGEKFYSNDTGSEVLVTYQLGCATDHQSFDIEVIGPDGSARSGCGVSPGRTEDHTFLIPAGGQLKCGSGEGICVWKGAAPAKWRAEKIRRLWGRCGRALRAFEARKLAIPPRAQTLLVVGYLLAVIWVNAYICRHVFFIEYTGRMNSIQGVWIAMARLARGHWYKPSWWPYWYNGMPFEFTYAPMTPGLIAILAWLPGISAAHGFQIVSGLVYCFCPAALFLMAWQLTGRAGWSFVAAVAYSLSSASELVLPDTQFAWSHIRDSRRMYLSFVWDELPHQLALGLVCIAVALLARALHDRRTRSFVWAAVAVALAMLASAFGATVLLMLVGCLLVTYDTVNWKGNFGRAFLCLTAGYLAMCPFLPPSLVYTIRSNGTLWEHMSWVRTSPATLAGVALGGGLLCWLSRKWRLWYLRFFLLAAYLSLVITALEEKWQLHFLPQSKRYKVEVELTLVLLVVFGAAVLIDRAPKTVRILLALAFLWAAEQQVIAHRRIAKAMISPIDITQTIEYQAAKWIEPNLPGWRVLAPGSFWPWLNAFSEIPQFTGGSFPTAPSRVQLHIVSDLNGSRDTAAQAIWYKAYGVDAVIVPGRDSPEFWQPHELGHLFDGVFPLVWDERDTQIYAVPRHDRTLAYAIPAEAVVSREPANTKDTEQVKRYVAALESSAATAAKFEWEGSSRARIRATVTAGQVISVHETCQPGWRASEEGRNVRIGRDGLGQIVLKPDGTGERDIQLVYDGGLEAKLCRALSGATLLAMIVSLIRAPYKYAQYSRKRAT